MNIGYCRVSTEDQNPDLQLAALQRAGCTRIFTDKATGVHGKRPQLTKCLTTLQAGDVLIVWKLDRLGRSLRDLITLLDELKARDIAFRSLTEALDTTTPTGRAMWQMVGILAELERSLIQERTAAGRTAAQARGVKMGRSRYSPCNRSPMPARCSHRGNARSMLRTCSRCRDARWNERCAAETSDTPCTLGSERVMRANTPREL
jgi:Enterobacteriaceae phage serine recombinase